MPSHYWIKLYHEILSDPKMGRLPDRTWRRAIELFLLAGETANEGTLPPLADIAWALRTTEQELIEDLEVLAEVGITMMNGDRWHVTNFGKRQAPVGNAQRQRQYRNKQRTSQDNDESVTEEKLECNESVTNCNADTDTDTDIDKIENIDTPSAASAHPPTPKQKTKPSKPKTPDAVRVFRENAHRYPPKSWYSEIVKAVGEDPANLELWGQVVKAYIGCGWNPGNVKNMLEFYGRREIPATKGQQKAVGEPAGFKGIREWGKQQGITLETP